MNSKQPKNGRRKLQRECRIFSDLGTFSLEFYVFSALLREMLCCASNEFVNTFQPNAVFLLETSHLICTANEMTGSYMKSSTRLTVDGYVRFSLKMRGNK